MGKGRGSNNLSLALINNTKYTDGHKNVAMQMHTHKWPDQKINVSLFSVGICGCVCVYFVYNATVLPVYACGRLGAPEQTNEY